MDSTADSLALDPALAAGLELAFASRYCKAGKRKPFTIDKFTEFFQLLPRRADCERSWTVDFVARKKKATEEAAQRIKELTKEARELAARAQGIEDSVYDLKAVNPNKKVEEDTRTPAHLLDLIEAKGVEVAEALAMLRSP